MTNKEVVDILKNADKRLTIYTATGKVVNIRIFGGIAILLAEGDEKLKESNG